MIRTLLACLMMAAPAQAGPDRWSIMLGSQHIGAAADFDQVNPGIFATWEDRAGGFDYSLGVFRNSYGRASVAGAAALPVWQAGDAALSLFAGLAHYPRDGRRFAVHAGDVVPIGGAQLRWRNTFIQIIPGDGQVVDAVVSFGLTFAGETQ